MNETGTSTALGEPGELAALLVKITRTPNYAVRHEIVEEYAAKKGCESSCELRDFVGDKRLIPPESRYEVAVDRIYYESCGRKPHEYKHEPFESAETDHAYELIGKMETTLKVYRSGGSHYHFVKNRQAKTLGSVFRC